MENKYTVTNNSSENESYISMFEYFNKILLNSLNKQLKANYTTSQIVEPVWIGGGSLRDYFINGGSVDFSKSDFDLYFKNQDCYKVCLDYFMKNKKGKKTFSNQNTTKLQVGNKTIDLIKRFYPEGPIQSFGDFDFTICCGSISSDNFYCHKDYFIHLLTKRLVINEKIIYPISTFWRVQKYVQKGFYLCKGGILKLVLEINKLNLGEISNKYSVLHLTIPNQISNHTQYQQTISEIQKELNKTKKRNKNGNSESNTITLDQLLEMYPID